ncbi:MAG: exodeoxyribonuclease VII small subunit [Saprospiraceae bacterium]|jgi:exodeoxyribonuclease VII small subunit|nr:exodeoxyribonuclease VII small subunit [Saprospiraceae bacterium]MDP4698952.1 exodeoxyribonuclease VII small subunit [Saprospiraceae bacterium]MDP4810710.1 exodeoxyribonuclease VII small subunit [Saprospiraceae bacterium]MDP4916023.1 exodeoxyribonuclease VII small subunit [Saprospiraceae bacterium]MDP5049785.1 exodeoxyribonuclease VII small subunit [Saprospiraceae bacterium]
MDNDNISYEQAYSELEAIINQLESDTLSIELLAEKVSRAAYLLELCTQKMRSIESDIQQIIGTS